jgi:hypothetical protein
MPPYKWGNPCKGPWNVFKYGSKNRGDEIDSDSNNWDHEEEGAHESGAPSNN